MRSAGIAVPGAGLGPLRGGEGGRGSPGFSRLPSIGDESRGHATTLPDPSRQQCHFDRLYRRRNDAESINRALDDTLWLRRAQSIGHTRQHLNLLTFAFGVKSLALHRHRTRGISPPVTNAA